MSSSVNIGRDTQPLAPASAPEQANNDHVTPTAESKQVQVIINLQAFVLTGQRATYLEIARKAFPSDPVSPDITYTITYTNPHGPDGELRDGEQVKLHEGMVFVVGKSNCS